MSARASSAAILSATMMLAAASPRAQDVGRAVPASSNGHRVAIDEAGSARPTDQPAETPPPAEESDQPAQPEADEPFPLDTTFRLEPVLVTARKWEEEAQDVPQGLSVIGEETIRDSGIRSVREASFLAPNVHLTEFTARRLSFPTVRGIASGIGDLTVTSFIDGVPQLTVSSTNIALLDVERIEFLRGPQGTLYGRNSVGGLIHIVTRRPTNDFELFGSATYGNYDLFEGTLGVSGPLKRDELYFGISGLFSTREGYTTNRVTGNDVDSRESVFGRGQLIWTPTDESEFRFNIYGERSRDGAFTLFDIDSLEDDPFRIEHSFDGSADRDIIAPSLTWNYFGESIEIASISAFVDWDIAEKADFDFVAIDAIRRDTAEDQAYFSQELRISSAREAPIELSSDATLAWMIGGQVFVADGNRRFANEFRPDGVGIFFPPEQVGVDTSRGEFDDLGLAIFGQTTLTLGEKLDLTFGLRYDYEHKEADLLRTFDNRMFEIVLRDAELDESFDQVVPRFSAAYHVTDDAMIYGLISHGFKAGGFNLDAPPGKLTFDEETSWSYEVGVKTRWLDDRLEFNAAAFVIDWEDLQVSLFDPFAGGFIDNAAEATSKGFELELAARPVNGLELFSGVGYVDAEFDEFVDQFGQDVSGNQVANVPDTTWHVGAQLSGDLGPGRWFVRGEYVNVGTYFFDAGNRRGDHYGLANFRLGYEYNNVRIEGWIRNAFDEEYVLVAFQPSPFDPTAFVGESGAPQTFGVTVSLRF